MPNISEFKQECAALGLSHIEVVQGDREPDVTLDMIKDGQVENGQITTGTYEYYESELKNLDIVFFSQDDVIQGVTFIGNSVFFTERGGSEESWTWKTHTINIPVDSGVRAFNAAVKDEFIANGVIGIMADSIDDVDNHDNYLDNSLYGKIESKLAVLMRNEGKTNLEGVKIPWLYNLITFRDSQLNSSITGKTIGDTSNALISNSSTTDRAKVLYCEPYTLHINAYSYCWRTLLDKNDTQIVSNEYDYTKLLRSINKFEIKTGVGRYGNSSSRMDSKLFNSGYKVYGSDYYIEHISYGGYNNPYYKNNLEYDGAEFGHTHFPTNITKFKVQPYLYGTVFWIQEIGKINNCYYLGGFLTIIGLTRQGKIIEPEIPYWTTQNCVIKDQSFNAHVQVTLDLTEEEIGELLTQKTIEYMPDWSEYSPLKGKSLFRIFVPMTLEENNYALNTDYIIAPENYIPSDYIDD